MQLKQILPFAIVSLILFTASTSAQNLSSLTQLLETPTGEQTSLAELGAGKVTIVSYGATWCVPCKKEMAAINGIYDSLQANGIEYIAVFIDNTKTMAKVGPYVSGKGYAFPVLLDPNNEIFEIVNGTEVPYALIYNQSGELKFKHDGYFEGDEEHLMNEALSLVPNASAEHGDETSN